MDNKEKQIDEMAKLICTFPQCIHYNIIGECATTECQTVDIAENLFNQGYRKASDIAREILGEFRNEMRSEITRNEALFAEDEDDFYEGRNDAFRTAINCLAELKKKYTEEKK